MQDNQDKGTNTNKVQTKYKRMDVCVVSKYKKEDSEDKETSKDEIQSTNNTQKKKMFVC